MEGISKVKRGSLWKELLSLAILAACISLAAAFEYFGMTHAAFAFQMAALSLIMLRMTAVVDRLMYLGRRRNAQGCPLCSQFAALFHRTPTMAEAATIHKLHRTEMDWGNPCN